MSTKKHSGYEKLRMRISLAFLRIKHLAKPDFANKIQKTATDVFVTTYNSSANK